MNPRYTPGNITQIKSDLGQTDYGYDRLSRLTQATPDQRPEHQGLRLQRSRAADQVGGGG